MAFQWLATREDAILPMTVRLLIERLMVKNNYASTPGTLFLEEQLDSAKPKPQAKIEEQLGTGYGQ